VLENRRLAEQDVQRSRFAAPNAQRSELEASNNNALLGGMGRPDRSGAAEKN